MFSFKSMFKIPLIGYKRQILFCAALIPSTRDASPMGMATFFALPKTKFARFRSIMEI